LSKTEQDIQGQSTHRGRSVERLGHAHEGGSDVAPLN
jgi:hypothetical protein